MSPRRGADSRFASLRAVLTAEAAKAYLTLDGEVNSDVVLWETMLAASRRNRLLKRLLENPGWFIAALYNVYGEEEYQVWRDEMHYKVTLHKLKEFAES